MRVECTAGGEFRVCCEPAHELVDLYTRQILSGAVLLLGAAAQRAAEGQTCALRIAHPAGQGELELRARVERVERAAPGTVSLRLETLAEPARSALEGCVTALLRGHAPAPWPAPEPPAPEPPAQSERAAADSSAEQDAGAGAGSGDTAADRALLLQEEATGKALEGRAVQRQLQEMPLAEKLQLALRGGKAARACLLREANPPLHAALVKNPRITSAEISELARNPTTGAEAIALIAASAQFMADPALACEIASHPRTQPQLAQRLLARLQPTQLRQLARSDRVRPNLRAEALRLLERRSR
jgi:hypothetical protein